MWLLKRAGERNGARLVRYSLLTLIIFMLVCTSLAIILVSFASDYSAALHDRTQGKYQQSRPRPQPFTAQPIINCSLVFLVQYSEASPTFSPLLQTFIIPLNGKL